MLAGAPVPSNSFICIACEAENPAANKFCESCGASVLLIQRCLTCGAPLQPTSRFCGQCGVPASNASAPVAKPKSVTDGATVDGERKRISVLFADIRGSTALIEGVDPEDAARRFEPVIAVMKESVHRYNGVVCEVLGDGVMALFGAPVPVEDHAARACLAALAIQEQLPALGDADIGVRVGIHSGEVVVRNVQTSLTTTLGAIGPSVHLASRMEQLAEVGGVYCTADTYDHARQYIEARHVGALPVKGISAPVDVYRVIGLRSAPASEAFREDSALEPLTGRALQLQELVGLLNEAERGAASVVGVVGEAGMGKSRLCFEFAEYCRRRGIYVLEARAAPFGQAMPLQPILDLLRDYFGIRLLTDMEAVREKVVQRLAALGADAGLKPLVLDFLGVAPDTASRKLDPNVRKARLIDFVCSLARAGAGGRASVVLIEDVHWIDDGSAEFVDALADVVFQTKTMLVLNFRPGLRLACMQRSHYRQIGLAPLDRAATEAMLIHAMGSDRSTDELRREIAARSQGNPFFLLELIRSLAAGGGLQGAPGAYRTVASAHLASLPPNVQGLLASRIDRLDIRAKNVLQIAAVVGHEAPLAVLSEVSGLDRADIAEVMRSLRQAEMAYESMRGADVIFCFRHPLTQEVAYHGLLTDRRRMLHAAVAKAIQGHFRDRLDEYAGLLAFHLEQAGELKSAAQFLMRSALWLGAKDPRQALAAWKKVVKISEAQPPARDADYMRMMASGQVVNFGWREGISVDEARVYFEKASDLAARLGDMRGNALIHAAYGRILATSGSADEYVEKVRHAQEIAGASSDGSLQVTLRAVLCHALRLSGRLREAIDVNDAALARVGELGKADRETLGFDIEVWLWTLRGRTLVQIGRVAEALPYLDRVIAMEPGKVDAAHRFIPHVAYVENAWSEGDAQTAARHAASALEIAEASGTPYVRVYAQWTQGLALMAAGEHARAATLLRETIDYAREKRAGLENEARLLADLSSARLAIDMAPRAMELADEALAIARERRTRVEACRAHIARAAAAKALGDTAQFEADRAEAARLIRETAAAIFERALNDLH